jgi:hypothetical protein
MTCRSVRSSLLCGLLLAVSCAATPSPAQPRREPNQTRWEPRQMQFALERLRPQERRSFFDSMRRWEDRRHRAQETFLERSERCLAEEADEDRRGRWSGRRDRADRCSERLLADRERMQRELRQERLAIHRRYGLPDPRRVAAVDPRPAQAASAPLTWLGTLLLGDIPGF